MQHTAGTAPDSETEYEYEYDETETETFYVNIDLTSHNGVFRQPRRGAPGAATADDEQEAEEATPSVAEDAQQNADEENGDATETNLENDNHNDRIQIMELHGKNPFASYHNNIFSCEWADMIGTDMHFVKRREDDDPEPDPTYLKRADDYSLIAANPIKIIGRKTRLTPATTGAGTGINALGELVNRSEEKTQQQQQQQPDGISAQVRFLQELMDIKREKGEKDMLRMTFGTRRGKNFEGKLNAWAHTDERADLVHQLNRAALAGDQGALGKLEDLYDHIEAGAEGFTAPAPTPTPAPSG